VHYPPDAPASALHYHFWSLLDQVAAGLLRIGFSERALSWFFSALAGVLSAQALAMLTFALTRATAPALVVPLLLMGADLTGYGVSYPIMLVGFPHTYGMLGLSLAMLAFGLTGSGYARAGVFLCAVAIAVQPTTGLRCAAFLATAALLERPTVDRGMRRVVAAGLAITILSALIFLALRPEIPHATGAAVRRLLTAFVTFWDSHRQPIDWHRRGVLLNWIAVVVAGLWLRLRRTALDTSARWMLLAVIVAVCLSAPLAALTWLDINRLPDVLVAAMPARLMNVGVFAAVPLIASTVYRMGGRVMPVWTRKLVLASMTWPVAAAAAIIALMFPARRLEQEPMRLALPDDPVWAVAATRDGILLTSANVWLAQLRTRRPVLLDGATLDTLPYALDAAPTVERILQEVYGQSLFAPPPDARATGQVSNSANRRSWEDFTSADWTRIRRVFGVTDVVAPSDWRLQLPVVIASPDLGLFALPTPGSASSTPNR
jgi:hypothetical protein